MKQPDLFEGLAVSESLLAGKGFETNKNLVSDSDLINSFYEPPSIIPGVPYPISGREEQLIRYTWRQAKFNQERGGLC
jgi:hypothetical protein